MRRSIKNKIYDTKTATYIGTYEHKTGYTEDNYTESLYLKKTGDFFLHGTGGINSHYTKLDNRKRVIAEKIIPIDYDEAKAWGNKHLNGDAYNLYFNVEDIDHTTLADKVKFQCTVTGECKKMIDDQRIKTKLSIGEIIERAMSLLIKE